MTVKVTRCTKCKRTLAKIFSVLICEVFGLFGGFGWLFFEFCFVYWVLVTPASLGVEERSSLPPLFKVAWQKPQWLWRSLPHFSYKAVQLSTSRGGTLIFLSPTRQMQHKHKKQYKWHALVISLLSSHPTCAALTPAYPTLPPLQCPSLPKKLEQGKKDIQTLIRIFSPTKKSHQ